MQYTHGRDRVFEVTEWACAKMVQISVTARSREVDSSKVLRVLAGDWPVAEKQ